MAILQPLGQRPFKIPLRRVRRLRKEARCRVIFSCGSPSHSQKEFLTARFTNQFVRAFLLLFLLFGTCASPAFQSRSSSSEVSASQRVWRCWCQRNSSECSVNQTVVRVLRSTSPLPYLAGPVKLVLADFHMLWAGARPPLTRHWRPKRRPPASAHRPQLATGHRPAARDSPAAKTKLVNRRAWAMLFHWLCETLFISSSGCVRPRFQDIEEAG